MRKNRHIQLVTRTVLACLIGLACFGCNKPRVDDIAPGLEGEWEWTKTREWFNLNGSNGDSITVSAAYDYRIHFNKRRRIEFYKNGECEGSKKIVELREIGPGTSFFVTDEDFDKMYLLDVEGETDQIPIRFKEGWIVTNDWPYGRNSDFSYQHYFKKQ